LLVSLVSDTAAPGVTQEDALLCNMQLRRAEANPVQELNVNVYFQDVPVATG
jgi:hypothetical protein